MLLVAWRVTNEVPQTPVRLWSYLPRSSTMRASVIMYMLKFVKLQGRYACIKGVAIIEPTMLHATVFVTSSEGDHTWHRARMWKKQAVHTFATFWSNFYFGSIVTLSESKYSQCYINFVSSPYSWPTELDHVGLLWVKLQAVVEQPGMHTVRLPIV